MMRNRHGVTWVRVQVAKLQPPRRAVVLICAKSLNASRSVVSQLQHEGATLDTIGFILAWGDAGLGALTAAALVLVGVAGVLSVGQSYLASDAIHRNELQLMPTRRSKIGLASPT